MSAINQLVVLRGGVSVPVAAYLLLLDFEARGIVVKRDDFGLLVGPAERMSDDHRRLIPQMKPYLVTLLDYCGRAGLDGHLFTDARPVAAAQPPIDDGSHILPGLL